VTVKVVAGEVIPPKVAVIPDAPAVTPVATPVLNPINATLGLVEAQVAEFVTSTGKPELMVAVAVNCLLPFIAIENELGTTKIDTTDAPLTVMMAGGEVIPL
jgi:hypothetical protein